MAGAERKKRNADLPVRVISALVMVLVAGTALWLGGGVWALFVALVAAGVLVEWSRLVMAFAKGPLGLAAWHLGGVAYVGLGAFTLLFLRADFFGPLPVLLVAGTVVSIDVWAYFVGRHFGGRKIAPSISPSKTWSGLWGAMAGAALVLYISHGHDWRWILAGPPVAVVAQAGDFFESWMKRRAGVKDSGRLLPGHGGLFDRTDGLLAVLFVLGLVLVGARIAA